MDYTLTVESEHVPTIFTVLDLSIADCESVYRDRLLEALFGIFGVCLESQPYRKTNHKSLVSTLFRESVNAGGCRQNTALAVAVA